MTITVLATPLSMFCLAFSFPYHYPYGGGYHYPYGGNPWGTYDRQYMPYDGPTTFNDENLNACSVQ